VAAPAEHTTDGLTRAWAERPELGEGPPGYLAMIDALRALRDGIATTAPPADLIADVTRAATDLTARLAPHAVEERDRPYGQLTGTPGRGQTIVPALHLGAPVDDRVQGHVTDDLLGRLANTGGRSPCRTAYLHVDYRNVTPLDTELRVAAWFEHEEGRKRLLRGTLHHGETLCVEVEGLFVALRPGQP
jgi:hypothetical protein